MPHPIHRVSEFRIIAPHTLAISFADGTHQTVDFRPVLHGPLFGPLQDLETFNGVALDEEAGTLTWPNGADFDPATLHDWPLVVDELAQRAQGWALSERRAHKRMEPTRR